MYDVTINSRHGTLLCSYFLDPKLICEFFRLRLSRTLQHTHYAPKLYSMNVGGGIGKSEAHL